MKTNTQKQTLIAAIFAIVCATRLAGCSGDAEYVAHSAGEVHHIKRIDGWKSYDKKTVIYTVDGGKITVGGHWSFEYGDSLVVTGPRELTVETQYGAYSYRIIN
jgi:hypothetical protein